MLHLTLDRALAHAEPRGNVFIAEVARRAQEKHLPASRFQFQYDLFDDLEALLECDDALGRRVVVGDVADLSGVRDSAHAPTSKTVVGEVRRDSEEIRAGPAAGLIQIVGGK